MSLISLQFIAFVGIITCLYFIIPKKFQWILLLIASFVFYIYGGWKAFAYILVTILTQYFLAVYIDNINTDYNREISEGNISGKEKTKLKKKYAAIKKKYVIAAVLINIGILCFVKYTNFMIDNVNGILDYVGKEEIEHLDILVPLGISFYTFQSLGYVIDVYRGKQKAERNFFRFALFVSYFPSIIQGPIGRYGELADQLFAKHEFEYKRVMFGIQRMLWGYIKKLVIAERAAVIVNEVFNNYATKNYYGLTVFIAVFLYGIQIYADFSGGMDIVCGLSEVFGITLTENFKRPYMARSIAGFWQRWHITLGAWMRNYLFYPISLSSTFNKLGKKCKKYFGDKAGKVIPTSLASFIVFLIVGIWHGANWKYVIYGIYQAFFVSTGTLFEDLYAKMRSLLRVNVERKSWGIFQMLRTILIVTIGRYFSRADSAGQAFDLLKATFRGFNPWVLFDDSFYQLGLDRKNFEFMIISIFVLFVVDCMQERGIRLREIVARQNIIIRWTIYYAAVFTLIIFGMYGTGYDAASFIYQQF